MLLSDFESEQFLTCPSQGLGLCITRRIQGEVSDLTPLLLTHHGSVTSGCNFSTRSAHFISAFMCALALHIQPYRRLLEASLKQSTYLHFFAIFQRPLLWLPVTQLPSVNRPLACCHGHLYPPSFFPFDGWRGFVRGCACSELHGYP